MIIHNKDDIEFVTESFIQRIRYLFHNTPKGEALGLLLFEIKRVLVYNSTTLKLLDLFSLYFFIENVLTKCI